MSKIVIDARELRTSSGRYVERLLHYLQTVDKDNSYEVLLKPQDMEDWTPTNPGFNKVSCPTKEFSFGEQTSLRKQIKERDPYLVHFTFAQQPIWYKGKTITTIHDLTTIRYINPSKNYFIFKFKQKVFGYVIKRSVNKASRVIVPSKFIKEDLVNFADIDPSKVEVTYEAADVIHDSSEPVLEIEGKPFIMYVGRPTPHKNLERLIEAYTSLKDKHPNLLLVLAGKKDINYKRIESNVSKAGTQGVVFTDFVSEGQLRWLYEHCQAYVFPSLSEGFGLPGLEAMLHGAPVVSSNATCLPEIYGDAAHYFNPTNTEAMAQAIDEVLLDESLRQELVDKGRLQAGRYSWERMARQTLDVYSKILKAR